MRKASLLMLISLVLIAAGMLAPTLVETQYTPGVDAVFFIKLPDDTQFMNVTKDDYDIGDLFNITVSLHNVTEMTAYGFTVIWNSTFCNATEDYWLDKFFYDKMPIVGDGTWSMPAIEYISNDVATDEGKPVPPLTGAFAGFGQAALGREYNVTGDFDICKIEFQVNAYGPIWFYLWKTTGTRESSWGVGTFTYCGWQRPVGEPPVATPQEYDVIWAPGYTDVANAVLFYQPYPPEAEKTVVPDPPLVNETVTVTVTQTKAGFDGMVTHDITNVTIDWGDTSPTEWEAPVAGVATFTHNYTDVGDYDIEVYCYAEGMPPDLAWWNDTNPITVVPEFPVYLLMPLFLTATIIAVVVAKTVWSKRPRGRVDVK